MPVPILWADRSETAAWHFFFANAELEGYIRKGSWTGTLCRQRVIPERPVMGRVGSKVKGRLSRLFAREWRWRRATRREVMVSGGRRGREQMMR
jgi:hypothetical protein